MFPLVAQTSAQTAIFTIIIFIIIHEGITSEGGWGGRGKCDTLPPLQGLNVISFEN